MRCLVIPEFLVFAVVCVRVLPPFIYPINDDVPKLGELALLVALIVASSCFLGQVLGARVTTGSALKFSVSPSLPKSNAGDWRILLLCVAAGLLFFGFAIPAVESAVQMILSPQQDGSLISKADRTALTKGAYFGGEYKGQGLHSAVQYYGWSILVAAAMARSVLNGRSILYWILLALTLLGAWMFVAGDGSRGLFLQLLVVAFISFGLRKRVTYRHLIALLAGLVFLGSLISLYSSKGQEFIFGDRPISSLFYKIGHRMFFANAEGDIYTIAALDSGKLGLGLGHYFATDVLNSTPGYAYGMPLGHKVAVAMFGDEAGTTFITGTAIAPAYADFGLFGVAASFLLSGFLAALSRRLLFRPEISFRHTVGLALMLDYVINTTLVGFATFFQGFLMMGFMLTVFWGVAGSYGFFLRQKI